MRRALAALLAVAAGALALVLAPVAPAAACGCGAPAPIDGETVGVGSERAIVSWADGRERIDMSLAMRGGASESGLIVPTPSPATVTLGDPRDFAALEAAVRPETVVDDDWWGVLGFGAGDGAAGGAPQVLDEVQLGPVHATTLAARDAAGLRAWLDAGGYAIRPEIATLLDDYVARGWYFVALRLTGEVPLDGDLDPLVIEFDSDALVYPLLLSRAALEPQTVRLWVFADHRTLAVALGDGRPVPAQETVWSGAAPAGFEGRGAWMTLVQLYFADPAAQVPGDLELVAAPSDEEVRPPATHVTRTVEFAGVPAGWAIVAGSLSLGVLLLVGMVVVVLTVVLRRVRS